MLQDGFDLNYFKLALLHLTFVTESVKTNLSAAYKLQYVGECIFNRYIKCRHIVQDFELRLSLVVFDDFPHHKKDKDFIKTYN